MLNYLRTESTSSPSSFLTENLIFNFSFFFISVQNLNNVVRVVDLKVGQSQKVFSIWSHPQKDEPNHWPSSYQPKAKSWGTEIWFIFEGMWLNWNYLLRLHHLYKAEIWQKLESCLQLSSGENLSLLASLFGWLAK